MSSAIPHQVLNDNSTTNTPRPNSPSRPPVVCVFCGASSGTSPAHLAAARDLGRALHENGMNLVYGGGTVGMMGEVARTLVSLSGPDAVHGIIPKALMEFERKDDAVNGSSTSQPEGDGDKKDSKSERIIDPSIFGRTSVVKDMHTRKAAMAKEVMEGGEGGGFVALSGGYGTLEELMEVTTWNQLGIHGRGIVVFNVEGYWDALMQWVKGAVGAGFISESNERIMVEAKSAEEVVRCLQGYQKSEGRFKLRWGEK